MGLSKDSRKKRGSVTPPKIHVFTSVTEKTKWQKFLLIRMVENQQRQPALGTELTPLEPGTNHIMLEKTTHKRSEKIHRRDVIFGCVTGSIKLLTHKG